MCGICAFALNRVLPSPEGIDHLRRLPSVRALPMGTRLELKRNG